MDYRVNGENRGSSAILYPVSFVYYEIMLKSSRQRACVLGLVVCVAASALVWLDQWTKALAAEHLAGRGTVPLLGDFAVLVYADNRGAFLSLGSALPEPLRKVFLILLPLVAIPIVIWALLGRGIGASNSNDSTRIVGAAEYGAAVLIIAGGVGNLIDRIFRGEVRDFLNFGVGRLRTGVMNLADLYIFFALVVIVGALLFRRARANQASDTGV
jgi:signal peptidase II